jgi:4-cresol dehydrogenase (hydroxylating)
MPTPPGVSQNNFDAALREFRDAIGPQWVLTSDADVATFKDAYTPLWSEPEDATVAAALAPDSVEQVQAIVRIADRYAIPLYTISTGRNLAYGGSAPVYSGSVVLDLKRMNRVLEVSEENAYALVEPGVSYFDLYRYIRERGYRLWIDCPEPGWGSVMGNALDHGAGSSVLPYRDHFDAHCGMEVVLADGTLVRTGMGALPGSQLWQQTKYSAGPMIDGIFSQSNFGIVTKMGFWLMPEPEASMTGTIRVPRHNDVIPLVRILSRLIYSNLVNCYFSVRSPVFHGTDDTAASALWDQDNGGTAEEWDAYVAARGLHFWETTLRFYGPPAVMRSQWEHVRECFALIPGAQFDTGELIHFPLTDDQINAIGSGLGRFGIPSLSVFTGLALSPGTTGHLDASVIVPMYGQALLDATRLFKRIFRKAGLAFSFGYAEHFHWRTFIMFLGMNLAHDREYNARVRTTYETIVTEAAARGWGIYRTHIAFMDHVMRTYAYNDHALMRLHETLKDALDPNGILAAGRYGIWPKRLRKSR